MNKAILLTTIGLGVAGTVQVIGHYFSLSDLTTGILTGLGLGLMIVGLMAKKPKPAKIRVRK